MNIAAYETELTDAQWEFLQPMLPQAKKRGRPPTDRRCVINSILYVLKGGIPWRLLPKHYPSWKTIYHIFRAWSLDNTWAALNDALRTCVRADEQRHAQPTAAILDSQSVKADGHGGVVVTPASCPEREGAQQVLRQVAGWFPKLRKLWVDGGYTGEAFAKWVSEQWPKLEVEVVKRSESTKGFAVLPRRWIVERTFGWLMRHRRLVQDYERTVSSAEAWIHLAMLRIQLRRLA